jgi:hypothetical protein
MGRVGSFRPPNVRVARHEGDRRQDRDRAGARSEAWILLDDAAAARRSRTCFSSATVFACAACFARSWRLLVSRSNLAFQRERT